MGVFLRQAWSKSQWTVLTGYLTTSTNVRRYQTHHRWQFFLSEWQHRAHRCIVRATQSNWVKNVISCFRVLPGSAEAQVIWGGIVKRLLIAYIIGIMPKILKSIHVCQSYSKPKVGRFSLRHGLLLLIIFSLCLHSDCDIFILLAACVALKSDRCLCCLSLKKLKKSQQELTKIYESFSRKKNKELSYNEQQIHKFDRCVRCVSTAHACKLSLLPSVGREMSSG